MKMLFEDEKFKKSILKLRAEKVLDQLEGSLQEAWPGVPGVRALNSPQAWAESALKLKQTLMLNREEYRVHFCKAGSLFDPTWMQAEDVDGFSIAETQAQTMRLATCLFPARPPKVLPSSLAQRSVPPPGELYQSLCIHPLSTPKVLFFSSSTDARSYWATCAWHPECSNSPLCILLRPSTLHRRSLSTPRLTGGFFWS